jgi:predicted nucleic acid-binding protein
MFVWVPTPGFEARLVRYAVDLDVRGARMFDLQIALTALEHGETEIWSHDRGFLRMPGISVRDPLE